MKEFDEALQSKVGKPLWSEKKKKHKQFGRD
jgi:hypothetical protein